MTISVLLPTRGRTTALYNSVKSLLDRADNLDQIEVLLAMDRDDVDSVAYAKENIVPLHNKIHIYMFDRLGYTKLNMYMNALAALAQGYWIIMWNDDALMNSQGWDTEIEKNREHPMPLLRMQVENFDHPFALFPIIKKEWFTTVGVFSHYVHNDRYLYNLARNICDGILVDIPVNVLHDRADITGNNDDDTFKNTLNNYTEGNPADPFNDDYPVNLQVVLHHVNKLRKHINNNYGYEIPLIDLDKPMQFIKHEAKSHTDQGLQKRRESL